MEMPERFIYRRFHIDANRINAKRKDRNMNKLDEYNRNDVIEKTMSKTAHEEAFAGNSKKRRTKSCSHPYSLNETSTVEERVKKEEIKEVLFPNGPQNQNQENDLEIVFQAWREGVILITNDTKHILKKRDDLKKIDVIVMDAKDAVTLVRREVAERDNRTIWLAKQFNKPLPDWVNKDYK